MATVGSGAALVEKGLLDLRQWHSKRSRWWEVVIYWAKIDYVDQRGVVMAQFRAEGDAYRWAMELFKTTTVYMYAILVR